MTAFVKTPGPAPVVLIRGQIIGRASDLPANGAGRLSRKALAFGGLRQASIERHERKGRRAAIGRNDRGSELECVGRPERMDAQEPDGDLANGDDGLDLAPGPGQTLKAMNSLAH